MTEKYGVTISAGGLSVLFSSQAKSVWTMDRNISAKKVQRAMWGTGNYRDVGVSWQSS